MLHDPLAKGSPPLSEGTSPTKYPLAGGVTRLKWGGNFGRDNPWGPRGGPQGRREMAHAGPPAPPGPSPRPRWPFRDQGPPGSGPSDPSAPTGPLRALDPGGALVLGAGSENPGGPGGRGPGGPQGGPRGGHGPLNWGWTQVCQGAPRGPRGATGLSIGDGLVTLLGPPQARGSGRRCGGFNSSSPIERSQVSQLGMDSSIRRAPRGPQGGATGLSIGDGLKPPPPWIRRDGWGPYGARGGLHSLNWG